MTGQNIGILAHMIAKSISRQERMMERGESQVKSIMGKVAASVMTMV